MIQNRMSLKTIKRIIVGVVALILVLTVLEFPAPVGFEVRPQDNVSLWWLALFLASLASEIATISLVFRWPSLGAKFGLLAATLNILQVVADQTHMMQPEIAPLGYLLLEDAVAFASLALSYFSWKILTIYKSRS